MVHPQDFKEEILPAALHFAILTLRLANRDSAADFAESALALTDFGKQNYSKYKELQPLERKIKRNIKKAKTSFTKSCKDRKIPKQKISYIITEVDEIFALDLNELEIGHAKQRQATLDPKAFKDWLDENTEKSRSNLPDLQAKYYSALVDAIYDAYANHVTRDQTYTNDGIDQTLESITEIKDILKQSDIGQNVKNTQRNLDEHLLNEPFVFGSFPQLVTHYAERFEGNDKLSTEAKIIESISSHTTQHTALIGAGGSGKTQCATRIAKQLTSETENKWSIIAWLDASSNRQLRNSLLTLGNSLGLVDIQNSDPENAVSKLLSNIPQIYSKRILFIYDNVKQISDIIRYIPTSNRISLLVTTRAHEGWDIYSGWESHKLNEFSKALAIEMIQRITGEDDFDHASKLIEFIGASPLTISQVGAMIREDPSLSLSSYHKQIITLGNRGLIKPVPGASHNKPVDKLLLANIDDLLSNMESDERTEGLRQLSSLCYLAARGIPRHWLYKDTNPIAARVYIKLQRAAIINESQDGTLSSIHGTLSSIHRLTAQIIRDNWELLNFTASEASTQAKQTLINSDPTDNIVENYQEVRSTTKQVISQYIAIYSQEYSANLLSWEDTHRHICSVLRDADITSLQSEALQLYELVNEVLCVCKSKSVRSDLHASYANLLRFAGQHSLAQEHYARALGSIRRLKIDKLITEVSYRRDQAHCLIMDQQVTKAIKLLEKCRKRTEHRLGKDNIHTISILTELGSAYLSTNNLQAVIDMLEHTLDIEVDISNYFQLTTVFFARNVLAMAYLNLGIQSGLDSLRDNGFGLLYRNACEIEAYLPPEHADAISYRQNLAWAFAIFGDDDVALAIYQQLLEHITEHYGRHHSEALNVSLNIGIALTNLHRCDEAIDVLSALEAELAKRMEPNSTVLANCRKSLGNAYFLLPDYSNALKNFEKVCHVGHSIPASLRSDIASGWYALADFLHQSAHFEEAQNLFELATSLYGAGRTP